MGLAAKIKEYKQVRSFEKNELADMGPGRKISKHEIGLKEVL